MVGGRQRKPTARALDAAESRLLVASLSRERPRAVGGRPASPATPAPRASASTSTTKTTYSAAAAPVKKNGRAQNARGKQAIERETGIAQEQVDEEVADGTLEGSAGLGPYGGQQDLTLYCVCLGYDTGEQPMIQCEHCSNWFHFGCVGLTDQVASQIEAYSCDMCEQMGMGSSRMLTGSSTRIAPVTTFYSKRGDDGGQYDDEDEPFEDEEEDEGEPEPEDDEDFEEDGSKKRSRKSTGGKGIRRKKESAEESSDDYDSDEDDEAPKKRRRPSAPTKRGTGSQLDVKPSLPPPTSVPPSDKTRSHVVKQLTSIFSSIYAADATAADSANSTGIEIRSAAFAEEVEGELFEGYAEPDDKNVRGPRAKYSAKFRSLHYNLKSNAYLRSRVAANELTANKLVNLTAEDLQTPELRAMAESVRAASLRNSVKEVLAAPTAKRTHKGEEEIESEAKLILEAEEAQKNREEAQKEADRHRSNSVAADSPGPFAGSPAAAGSPVPQSPGNRDSPSFFSTATPRHRSSLVPGDASTFEKQGSPALPAGSPKLDEIENDMSPPPAPNKPRGSTSSFDMSSIWGKVKAASPTPTEEPKDGDAAGQEDKGEGEAKEEKDEDDEAGAPIDEDFEDDLFRDPDASPKKRAPAPPPAPAFADLPPVWAGDLIVPEEGGVPAFAIQVGGRPIGSSLETWTKLLPRGLTTAGRLPTAKATKYLIECALAPTRELIIAALMPDTTGPSAAFPHKPTKDSCLAKHQHIVDTYLKRDRVGVVQPPKELSKLVKDIYIVPLRRDASVPEYVELVDEHCLPEKRKRSEDLILAVLVVQKGALPTVKPQPTAVSAPPPPVVSAPPAASPLPPPAAPFGGSPVPPHGVHGFSPPPPGFSPPYQTQPYQSPPPPPAAPADAGFDPAVMQSLLSQVDPNTINNLLANPSLLNNLPGFGGSSATQQPPPPPMHQGYAPPPPAMHGYAPPPPTGYGYPPPPPSGPAGRGGPPVHPSRLAMMGNAPPPDAQYGQQHGGASPGGFAPPGAPRDQGWGARRGGGGGYGY
ncbi:hypothetical protein NBRC10512_003186 [Rhodotorula toruloides]|uniref:Transcription factor BYE1 n=2 Tax=Rhodotorula toruloides TaxID=5286 RepID=A0A061ATI1_RHOTO|nr:zinc finger protein [Rhodotorula toruloides NP11]EMS23778.1 zinc finger protein [Rhodotorula toruloides NP11]CDR40892.1 RHTO0S05e08416g1_1 [Rhodotorula toruloides]